MSMSPVPAELLSSRRLQVVVYSAFIDESGKFGTDAIVSIGAVVGYEDQWAEFTHCWASTLAEMMLPNLTMKEALMHDKPLSPRKKALGPAERNKALMPFARCIRKYLSTTISVSVDCAAFAGLTAKLQSVLKDDPHYLAFIQVLLELGPFLRPGDLLSVICDEDEQTAIPMYKLYRRIKKQTKGGQFMRSISFADDRQFAMLQAADMIASLSRLEVARRERGHSHDYGPLIKYLVRRDDDDHALQFLVSADL